MSTPDTRMAVASAVPALPQLQVPVVPAPPQALPLPYQPGPLLQQGSFPAATFFGPSSFPQPQAPLQPRRQPRQNKSRPWKPKKGQQQPSTGLPDFDQLRWKNSKRTRRAFGAAAGGFANRASRQGFKKPPAGRKAASAAPGVQHTNFKRPTWTCGQPARRQLRQQQGASSRQRGALPARARTPATIVRTPASIQRTPSVLQQDVALPGAASHTNGTPPLTGQRRRRRESQDPNNALLGAGLDFFGTNEGLILRRSASLSSSAGSDADNSGSDSEPANDYELRIGSASAAPVPQHVQAHIDGQADQIAQLEVDNARLSDENINLRERLFLMEKEMAELRHIGAASTEEDAPQQWFGMVESDCLEEDCTPRAAILPAAAQKAKQPPAVALPSEP